ncbi:MAG TPA: porin, partial [Bauldia sp.]|nr:porin [Bauldia sp.]
MKLKTALLASAAAFAVVGGAQAADLSVAEPVEYVKACEAFGAGYYYIPGSDTCLHVFGHVEFDAGFHANSAMYDPAPPRFTRSSTWGFTTTGEVEFNAKSMTDVGILEGAVGITGTYDTSPANVAKNDDALLDYAYLKIGGLKAGHFGSTYRPGGSYVDDFGISNELRPSMGDSNHLELSFKEGSVGLALGLEDPREDFTGHLPVNYSMPLIDGNMTFGGTNWSGFVSAGYTQLGTAVGSFGTSSYGVSGVLTLNLTPMDSVMFEG